MVDIIDAANRLDRVEQELDTVLADFEAAEEAIDELEDAFNDLKENPNDDDALAELQQVATKHHPSYTSDKGVISRLSSTIETLPGPAQELEGTLETAALASSLREAFGAFEDVTATFTYADSRVSTPVGGDFLDELEDRINRAPERLQTAQDRLETAQGQFPDPATSQRKINEARRERERREAERLQEEYDEFGGFGQDDDR